MKVLKFGGTSVGTPESLRCVKAIVESVSEPCVVVVSALGGITNSLIDMAEQAAAGNDFEETFKAITIRHHAVIEAVVPYDKRAETTDKVNELLDELHTVCKALQLLRELTERSLDLMESYGERMSCIIVTAMLPGAELFHSLDFIRTKRQYGKSVLDSEVTSAKIAQMWGPEPEKHRLVVSPGFIARDADDRISNLGRGGSDYTAAIIAAELGASVLEIWTDVDGFMTADPRIVKNAKVIDRLSFVEAMELCNFGAKVVYPPTIFPVFHANIPILIKNTFNATHPGTLIAEGQGEQGFVGVSAIDSTCLLEIEHAPEGYGERMINSLTRNGVETLMPDSEACRCGVRKADAPRAVEILSDKFAQELADGIISEINLTEDLATIAIVTSSSVIPQGASRQLSEALNVEGIPVSHTPRQASPGAIACMVPRQFLNQALIAIHNSFIK